VILKSNTENRFKTFSPLSPAYGTIYKITGSFLKPQQACSFLKPQQAF
jgi:hypothetical protein